MTSPSREADARPARYFAIVIRGDDTLGNVLSASTELAIGYVPIASCRRGS